MSIKNIILEIPGTQTDDLERFYDDLKFFKKNRFFRSCIGKDGRKIFRNIQHLELKIRWEVARI